MGEFESFNQLLIDLVKALGGSKKVAPSMWPEKLADEAARLLCDSLNNDRPQKLSPDQAMYILKMARERNFHFGIELINDFLGYSKPTPIQKDDENAVLQRDFIEAVNKLDSIKAKLQTNGVLKAVA